MNETLKSIFRDIYFRNFLLFIFLLITVCTGICIYLDFKAFLVNFLSGVVVSGISLIAGLFLVDRVVEYLREKRWSKVRKLIFRNITHHFHEVISWMTIYLQVGEEGIERPNFAISRTSIPNQVTLEYSGQLIKNIKRKIKNNEPLSGDSFILSLTSVIEFYKWIEWRLHYIEIVLVPRLIESSTEQILIDNLIIFESSIHKLRNSVKYCEFDVCDNEVLPSFIDFLVTFHDFYKLMYSRF
ncbi:hypothetical protein [Synechococcus sp. PCC 6312]|uniref:hypothetical protein n=1 Tax=Synechococcus sp. (strain ATCC 27167 / PCC 6312) TaxID=195253 RepID=UPI00029F0DC1|nr:hypothetical protein [Synechococcus sp. PCC 6312]AFY59499.1 hypothetical protein Syn6312_0258 [Synechococcus sp. PCC 6312]